MEYDDIDLKNVLTKIGEDYKLLKYLGGGGFSKVYLVRHKIFGEERALKIMDTDYILQRLKKKGTKTTKKKYREVKERFINEAKLYKKIDHPNIVKIYDVGVVSDKNRDIEIAYLIMAYIRGVSLEEVLESSSPFDMQKILNISENILSALDAIHRQKVIHRDIKPGNIMLEMKSGEAILIDFGLAKDKLSETDLTTDEAYWGTPPYMSPEQCKGFKDLESATDIYSFGIVLYEMLTGELPFKGKHSPEVMYAHLHNPVPDPRKKKNDLPAGVEQVIFKALAKDKKDRYGSAEEFLRAVKEMGKQDKPKKNFTKYLIYSLAIIALAITAFFVFKPPGVNKGEVADSIKRPGEINDTVEVKKPSETITQIENMRKEFEVLKVFLNGRASKSEKVEKCREFLNKHSSIPGDNETGSMIDEIKKEENRLVDEIEAEYRKYFDPAKEYEKKGDYEKAAVSANKARQVNDTKEVRALLETIAKKQKDKNEFERRNGKERYDTIKGEIDLDKYSGFKKEYPDSIYIPDLRDRLKAVDKTLPPGKYWDKSIKKNSKGFYELTFDKEHNGHIMIYIPEKNIWMDKYEVSWGHFRRFLAAEKRKLPPKKSYKYIHNGDDFPAVVKYEEAGKYCKRYGFRLPKEDEWEYAAGKGKEKFIYPWGNELPGEGGKWRANFESLKDGFEGTSPVKSFEKFSSPFDVVNMAGNVWEWVQGKILKGGNFISEKEDLVIKKSITGENNDERGFRCVKECD